MTIDWSEYKVTGEGLSEQDRLDVEILMREFNIGISEAAAIVKSANDRNKQVRVDRAKAHYYAVRGLTK